MAKMNHVRIFLIIHYKPTPYMLSWIKLKYQMAADIFYFNLKTKVFSFSIKVYVDISLQRLKLSSFIYGKKTY